MSAWSSRMALFWVYLHPLWRERSPALRPTFLQLLNLNLTGSRRFRGFLPCEEREAIAADEWQRKLSQACASEAEH